MATGKQKVGLAECEFNKKGELVSKKESSIDPKKPMVALTFEMDRENEPANCWRSLKNTMHMLRSSCWVRRFRVIRT